MKLKLTLLLIAFTFGARVFAQTGFPFDDEIRNFKHEDSLSFPKPDGILFIGSSSIRKWEDLEQRFPNSPIIKRGVGGSELSQLVKYYTPYILFPYHPAKIFVYAGENDIAAGETADSVFANFKVLYAMIRQQLPDAKIYYMSIKPSPSRLQFLPEFRKANKLIKDYLADKPGSLYINMNTVLYKAHTTVPDSTLFQGDYLHLNPKGYDRWQKILEPFVK
ncbi:MAG: hypothetical protein JWP37_1446 [Mucilaginibacter sp.]|nr:hypothetical protein [Mucilaginibacter sp.]